MTREEPLNLKANGTLKLDRKSINYKKSENTWNYIGGLFMGTWFTQQYFRLNR